MTIPKKAYHVPPQRQPDGIVELVFCPSCVTVAAWDDMNPVKPCPRCGEKVLDKNFSGTWEDANAGLFQWFHKPEGWWRVTSATKAAMVQAYDHALRRKSFEVAAKELGQSTDFYDLDFTKTLSGKK